MSNTASGKHAKFISDRSGMEFPYKEMVKEWNGSRVHISEFEPKQPQLEPKPHTADPQGLKVTRPARTEPQTDPLLPGDPFNITSGSTTITVITVIVVDPDVILKGSPGNNGSVCGSVLAGLVTFKPCGSAVCGFGSNCGCLGSNSEI